MSTLAEGLLRGLLTLGFVCLVLAILPFTSIFAPPQWFLVTATSWGFALIAITMTSLHEQD